MWTCKILQLAVGLFQYLRGNERDCCVLPLTATNLLPVQTQRRGTRGEWQAISESTPAFNWLHIASRSREATEETSQQAQSHLTFRHNMSPAQLCSNCCAKCPYSRGNDRGKKHSRTMMDSYTHLFPATSPTDDLIRPPFTPRHPARVVQCLYLCPPSDTLLPPSSPPSPCCLFFSPSPNTTC